MGTKKCMITLLSGLFLLAGCTGKSKQPSLDSLWETETAVEETNVSKEFILPDFTREKEIDKDSVVIYYRISPAAQSVEKYSMIDSAMYAVTYDVSMIHDPANLESKVNDIHILQIGNKVSKTFSRYIAETDSMDTESRKNGITYMVRFNFFPEDIYKNYPEGKITLSHRTPLGGPILKYEEALPEFNWQITGQTKQILSYTCQKATVAFRGREYEAWFAPDIPLQEGPWKFNGLPGLILEVYDTQKQFVFTCKSFSELKRPAPLVFWEWDYKETNRATMDKFLRQAFNNPQAYIGLYNNSILKLKHFENIRNMVFPYNPMELE